MNKQRSRPPDNVVAGYLQKGKAPNADGRTEGHADLGYPTSKRKFWWRLGQFSLAMAVAQLLIFGITNSLVSAFTLKRKAQEQKA